MLQKKSFCTFYLAESFCLLSSMLSSVWATLWVCIPVIHLFQVWQWPVWDCGQRPVPTLWKNKHRTFEGVFKKKKYWSHITYISSCYHIKTHFVLNSDMYNHWSIFRSNTADKKGAYSNFIFGVEAACRRLCAGKWHRCACHVAAYLLTQLD